MKLRIHSSISAFIFGHLGEHEVKVFQIPCCNRASTLC